MDDPIVKFTRICSPDINHKLKEIVHHTKFLRHEHQQSSYIKARCKLED